MPTQGKLGASLKSSDCSSEQKLGYTVKKGYQGNDIRVINVALLGNPNCGKSTLFNYLTKSHQHVGNWPGVTVEKKEGTVKYKNFRINITDLPGVYSLSPCSFEEIITRDYLLENEVDVILNVLDSTNLERNLYLTTQLLEFNKPVILALNMVDLLKEKNIEIDLKKLQSYLKVPIVPICANKGTNFESMIDSIINFDSKRTYQNKIYPENISKVISNIEKVLIKDNVLLRKGFTHWVSVKLFEDDTLIENKLRLNSSDLIKIQKYKNEIPLKENLDRHTLVATERYNYISVICREAVVKKESKKGKFTDTLDNILLNRALAFPLFFLIMAFIFFITFGPFGTYLKDVISDFICKDFGKTVYNFLNNCGASNWSKNLVSEGIIVGVGSVVSFLPQIVLLFTLLSFLEDSGYMARAAFIMDKPLKLLGLSGKAFVPLLMGFGCSVPAVLGTRILEKDKDKKRTIFMIPFMSCGAKMPIYAMFISAFFMDHQVISIISIYLLGVLVSIFTALILKGKSFKQTPFIMELPDYKLPTFRNLFKHVWEKVKDFLEKAGTVLVVASVIIWFLQSFNFRFQMVLDSRESILASIGAYIAPIFSLCGFGDWRASVSLLCGIIAKESVVSTMAILYSTGTENNLQNLIASNFSGLSAYSFMVFALLYTPCIAALSAIKKELNSTKIFVIYLIYQLFIAWGVSALVFQVGRIFLGG